MTNKYKITLSIKKRILLHLAEHSKLKNKLSVDNSITQAGIAGKLGIRIEHVSRELKELVLNEYVYFRSARIKEINRRKKAYFLTEKGSEYEKEIQNEFKDKIILIRTIKGEIREIYFNQLNEFIDYDLKPSEAFIYSSSNSEGIIDLKKIIKDKENE